MTGILIKAISGFYYVSCDSAVYECKARGNFRKTGISPVVGDTVEFTCTDNILEAAKDSDVLYTDVWASMGQEAEKAEREKVFTGYQINDAVMAAAKSDAMVQHCLPAHRGEEITAEVFEKHATEIFEEAENRLHAQKAVMVTLMAN